MNVLPRSSMRPIGFDDGGREATREFVAHFEKAAPGWERRVGRPRLDALRNQLAAIERIDRQYGGETPLQLEGADDLVDAILGELAHLYGDLRSDDAEEDLAALVPRVA